MAGWSTSTGTGIVVKILTGWGLTRERRYLCSRQPSLLTITSGQDIKKTFGQTSEELPKKILKLKWTNGTAVADMWFIIFPLLAREATIIVQLNTVTIP
jgi:hypothetical protein